MVATAASTTTLTLGGVGTHVGICTGACTSGSRQGAHIPTRIGLGFAGFRATSVGPIASTRTSTRTSTPTRTRTRTSTSTSTSITPCKVPRHRRAAHYSTFGADAQLERRHSCPILPPHTVPAVHEAIELRHAQR